jgi:hypothetical protein
MELMIIQTLAHAGEEHSDVAEAVTHFAPWYIAIPLFIVTMAIIGYLTWLVSGKKLDTVFLVLAFCMLIIGFTAFTISPIVSVLAITIGIILAGLLAFVGLTGDSK